MTLTTHIIIAAAATKPFAQSHPILGFFFAILSHYLADAVPHWDYRPHYMQGWAYDEKEYWDARKTAGFRKRVIRDISRFAVDGLLGAGMTLAVIRPVSTDEWLWVIAAIIGGALPDFLQGLYLSGVSFLHPLQRFHDFCHTKIKLGPYPLIGIPFQLAILLVSLYFLA